MFIACSMTWLYHFILFITGWNINPRKANMTCVSIKPTMTGTTDVSNAEWKRAALVTNYTPKESVSQILVQNFITRWQLPKNQLKVWFSSPLYVALLIKDASRVRKQSFRYTSGIFLRRQVLIINYYVKKSFKTP